MKSKFLKWRGLGMFLALLMCALLGVTDGVAMAAGLGGDMDAPALGNDGAGTAEGQPGRNDKGTHLEGGTGNDNSHGASVGQALVEAPGLMQSDLDKAVLSILPYKTPLDTILRYCEKRNTDSIQVSWATVDIKPFMTTVTADYTEVSTAQTAKLSVSNTLIFAKTQTILVDGVTGADGKSPLMLYVADKDDSTITVIAVNGKMQTSKKITYVPGIDEGTKLFRLGRAAQEIDIQTESYTSYPAVFDNFCQSFKCQVEVSEWYKKSRKNLSWEKEDIKRHAIYEWKMEMEGSFLCGQKGHVWQQGKGDTYFAAGIMSFIDQKYEYSVWDKKALNALSKQVFSGNAGSDRRFFLMGSDLMEAISNINFQDMRDITKGSETLMDITWTTIKTNFGTLYCLNYQMLDEYGMGDQGIVIDPDYLYKYVFEAEHNQSIDKKSTGEANVDADVTTEVCCVALKYPECHMLVKKAATTSA